MPLSRTEQAQEGCRCKDLATHFICRILANEGDTIANQFIDNLRFLLLGHVPDWFARLSWHQPVQSVGLNTLLRAVDLQLGLLVSPPRRNLKRHIKFAFERRAMVYIPPS